MTRLRSSCVLIPSLVVFCSLFFSSQTTDERHGHVLREQKSGLQGIFGMLTERSLDAAWRHISPQERSRRTKFPATGYEAQPMLDIWEKIHSLEVFPPSQR